MFWHLMIQYRHREYGYTSSAMVPLFL